MKNSIAAAALFTLALLTGCTAPYRSADVQTLTMSGPLFDTIAALDAAVFEAFNSCATPGQLLKHGGYFAADVEFYHDTGGVTWNREQMLANTNKYACGTFRRELVAGSLRVFPIKDFGAIEQGVHRFCQFSSGSCEGAAEFLIVWRQQDGKWSITRVLSYGHRPI